MPNRPTFSIITCTWNSAATLADTLASLRAQTCQDLEHIFVDGGSVDATLDMIAAHPGDKRVLHDIRGGIAHAMNRGIEAATGRYIAHLHADDYYAGPDVLATVLGRFETVDAGGLPPAWVVGNIRVQKDGQLREPHRQPRFSYRAYAAGRASIPHPAVFIRRSVFAETAMFDEGLRYAMDIDLWLRLAAVHAPAPLAQVLAVFRDHPASLSSANKLAARREEFAVRRRHARQAPLAFGIYCLRHLKRLALLRLQAHAVKKLPG